MRHILTDLRGNPIYSFAARRLRRIRHSHLSSLFCMVQNRTWEDVLRRAKSHPHEVLVQDDVTGNTPLHVACRLDPPEDVIRALQATCRIKNHEGATPLHIAASHRCSAESLSVLLDCASLTEPEDDLMNCKDHVSPTADLSRMGRAPIHYACMSFRGLELDAFRLLFEATLKDGNLQLDNNEKRLGLDDFIDEELDEEDEELDDDFWRVPEEPNEERVTVNVMGMKDATGQTPLGLLFRRYRERVRVVISTVDRIHTENNETPDQAALAAAMTVHADLGELWQRARWIIARLTEERLEREGEWQEHSGPQSPGEAAQAQEAASWATEQYQSTETVSDDDIITLPVTQEATDASEFLNPTTGDPLTDNNKSGRPFRIVHASVGLIGYGCPPEMIRLAISIHPNQVREMDEDGNLPIHIAVTASCYLGTANQASPSTMAAAAAAAADASDDLSVLSDTMSFFSSATVSQTINPFDKVLKILLQHYPEGAKIPQGRTGRLALVLAVEAGRRTWEDGIRTLLYAYPPALHNKKLIEPELYPNVLSLVTSGHSGLGGRADFHCCTSGIFDDLLLPLHVGSARSKRQRREASNSQTTLFELLRTKPEWLTKTMRDYASVDAAAVAKAKVPKWRTTTTTSHTSSYTTTSSYRQLPSWAINSK
jgi:hypothetical protein